MANGAKPTLKSFHLCDCTIRDHTSMKYSVIGIFGQVSSPEVPVFHPRLGVYLMLGGMNGTYDLAVDFIDPDGERIAHMELKGIKHVTPNVAFESGINLPGLQFTKFGTHEVNIYCNNELLHVHTFEVSKVDPPKEHK